MRDIKFKSKRADNGDWIFGDLVTSMYVGQDGTWIKPKYDVIIPVDEEYVCEYSGMKDRNFKEIYEGDIVNVFMDSNNPIRMYVVYEYGEWGIREKYDPTVHSLDYYTEQKQVVVISNIFDRPELLNDDDEDED